jgi:hypothetical protein
VVNLSEERRRERTSDMGRNAMRKIIFKSLVGKFPDP